MYNVYIYIYIYRERDIHIYNDNHHHVRGISMLVCVCIYIYIYVYTCIHIYIYIYIHIYIFRERYRKREIETLVFRQEIAAARARREEGRLRGPAVFFANLLARTLLRATVRFANLLARTFRHSSWNMFCGLGQNLAFYIGQGLGGKGPRSSWYKSPKS